MKPRNVKPAMASEARNLSLRYIHLKDGAKVFYTNMRAPNLGKDRPSHQAPRERSESKIQAHDAPAGLKIDFRSDSEIDDLRGLFPLL